MNKFILLALVAGLAQGASLADLNDSTELTSCADSMSYACMTKDDSSSEKNALKNADADINKAGGDIVGTIIGIVVGVCCLCCVLPLVVWCMFFKAAVDIAEANQQPMLGGGETVVVVEEGGL